MVNAFVELLFSMENISSVVDNIGDLPTEVAANIFRYLDEESLAIVARVNQRWKSICKGDPILRRRIYTYLRKQRQIRIRNYYNASTGVQVQRSNSSTIFGQRNGTVTVRSKPVEYEVPVNVGQPQIKLFQVLKKNNSSKIQSIEMKNNSRQKKKKLVVKGNVNSIRKTKMLRF